MVIMSKSLVQNCEYEIKLCVKQKKKEDRKKSEGNGSKWEMLKFILWKYFIKKIQIIAKKKNNLSSKITYLKIKSQEDQFTILL